MITTDANSRRGSFSRHPSTSPSPRSTPLSVAGGTRTEGSSTSTASPTLSKDWTLEYRRMTAGKHEPKEVVTLRNLSEPEAVAELARVLPLACWVYVQNDTVEFAGKA